MPSPAPAQPVVAVVGATATGKSQLAVALALRLGGDVVTADSMQLYRGMDIGTAKPTADERCGVAHHALDVWPVTQTASVAGYQAVANAAIHAITDSGRVPILAGGSGLYVGAVLDDVRFPGTDPAVRARLDGAATELGPAAMHRQLADVDPVAAATISPTNVRRVVRALEVVEITGRPFRATLPRPQDHAVPAVQVGLRRARDELGDRIERRVAAMFDAGLVDEVRRLEAAGLREGRTASRAIGYAQVLDLLDGSLDLTATVAATAAATRRLARRQDTWFRRDTRITWFDADADDLVGRVLRHLQEREPTMASSHP